MAHKQPFSIIDGVLVVVIIGLVGLLIYVIWEPGQIMARMENYKWESRARMSALRIAELQFYNSQGRYTQDIDSLLTFVQDSIPPAIKDSLFPRLYTTAFHIDSLRFSPMSHSLYQLMVMDTSLVPRYMITCPDGFGYISSLTNPDEHNRASWEQ